jgi:predicted transcriptional regulator of viral defense system
MRITVAQQQKNASLADGGHLDAKIVARARCQHGVVSRTDLLALGASDGAIGRRLAVGRLFRLHRGVYSIVPPSMLSRDGRYMAAALAGATGTLISHRPAAALHRLRSPPAGPIDITLSGIGTRNRPGLRVHSSRRLHSDDVDEIDGIPCTSVARTLIDIAATETQRALTKMVEKALMLQIYNHAAVEAALDRAVGRAGPAALRRVLAEIHDDPPNTANDFERDFLFLVEEEDLQPPIVNGWVCDHQVDFHWPAAKLIVEADGRATHANPIGFERDRARDLTLALAGWRVMRISARQLRREPERVAAVVRAALEPYAGGGTTGAVAAAASMSPEP